MPSLKHISDNFFKELDASEDYEIYQIYFIYSLSIIGIVFISIVSVYNLFSGIYILGLGESIITLILIVNLFLFKKYQNVQLGSVALLVIMIVLSLLLLITGGIENTGIFWLFIYPVLAFFLQGSFYGFLWVILFLLINFLFALMSLYGIVTISYSFIEVRQFLISLFVLSTMVFFYEIVMSSMKNRLKNRNKNLQIQIQKELEKNRKKEQQLLQQSRLAQMGEMISMIAHQWRQPLGAISTTAVSMRFAIELEEYDLDTKDGQEKQNEYLLNKLNNIEKYVQNLTTTIDDFRNFYKPNKKRVESSLKDICERSLSIIKASLESDGIEIINQYNSKE
ncbi:MAG: hypothetical protein U9P72_05555 [Campylobacterota bacterium]|nr:hypothetical protein [Campylobacterota bacterium]